MFFFSFSNVDNFYTKNRRKNKMTEQSREKLKSGNWRWWGWWRMMKMRMRMIRFRVFFNRESNKYKTFFLLRFKDEEDEDEDDRRQSNWQLESKMMIKWITHRFLSSSSSSFFYHLLLEKFMRHLYLRILFFYSYFHLHLLSSVLKVNQEKKLSFELCFSPHLHQKLIPSH